MNCSPRSPPRSGHHGPPAKLRSLLEDTTSVKERPRLIELAGAAPGDKDAIAALCAELDKSYGDTPQGTPAYLPWAQVRAALPGDRPLARA